jgi:hypothetical protein
MRIKFILPALVEAQGRRCRPIKYSLFPPLGRATLAGYVQQDDVAEIVDEPMECLRTDGAPDLVAVETYVSSVRRCHAIADQPPASAAEYSQYDSTSLPVPGAYCGAGLNGVS